VAIAFTAVAVVVVKMTEDYIVTQRVNEKLSEVNSTAIRMASLLNNMDSEGMYALALESAKKNGGRYLVLNPYGVVLADSFSRLNGKQLKLNEIYEVLSSKKDMSYAFHVIQNDGEKNESFWAAYYAGAILYEGKIIGAVVCSESIQDVVDQSLKLTEGIILLSIGVCLAVIFISLFLSGYITKPIKKLRDVVQKISDGHFNERVLVAGRNEIAQLGDAFNKMSERLENIDIQRSEFVSNASHELKTPLSSIKILAESLLYQQKMDENIVREFLADINSEIDRLDQIITDLLAITKLDNQVSPLKMDTVPLQAILESTILGLKPLADQKRIKISLLSSSDIAVTCDTAKIKQAFINLIDNAIKYTQEKGTVTIRLSQSGGYAKIEVQDTGIGIPEENLPYIFERFYRVDKARSRETGGTGLGLYITKRIAALHNGTITVQSKEGEGSLFTLYLPVQP